MLSRCLIILLVSSKFYRSLSAFIHVCIIVFCAISEYRSVFQIFDKNGDDKISTTELGSVLSALGQDSPDAKLQEMITEYDVDGKYIEDLIQQ